MPKYKIIIFEESEYETIIEAENEEEASNMIYTGEHDFTRDLVVSTADIHEIKETK